jgi:hypothetical protein
MQRWTAREFLDAERLIAKWWRKSLTSIDFDAMVKAVMVEIGPHWRKPKTLQDARQMIDIIIDHMDKQWLLGFGIDLLGVSDLKEHAISDWVGKRRPSLRQCMPYPEQPLLECYEELARKFPQGLAGLPQLPEELSGAVHAIEAVRV